jgi:SAM-dependent methyltransferase
VIAVDLDAELLAALRERAAGLPVATVQADARAFELRRRDLALCIVPMQTVQLLDGPAGRAGLLRAVRSHLRPGGLLACAIATRLETFDAADGPLPTPDVLHTAQAVYVSRPIAVRRSGSRVLLERERERISLSAVGDSRTREQTVIALDRLSARRFEREAAATGFRAERARRIAATPDYVGSTVVMLRA